MTMTSVLTPLTSPATCFVAAGYGRSRVPFNKLSRVSMMRVFEVQFDAGGC